MPRILTPLPFNPSAETIARRKFKANGREFAPGEVLPWRQLALSQRRVRQMYDNGMVHQPGATRPAPLPSKVYASPTVDSAAEVATEEDVVGPDTPEAEPVESAPEEPAELVYEDMSIADLRTLAIERGLPTRRTRVDMIELLRQAEE